MGVQGSLSKCLQLFVALYTWNAEAWVLGRQRKCFCRFAWVMFGEIVSGKAATIKRTACVAHISEWKTTWTKCKIQHSYTGNILRNIWHNLHKIMDSKLKCFFCSYGENRLRNTTQIPIHECILWQQIVATRSCFSCSMLLAHNNKPSTLTTA